MPNDDKRETTNAKLVPLVIALLGAFGGGFGSNYLWIRANPDSLTELVRPDPFTGSDGRALERRIDSVSAQLAELNNRVSRMSPEEVSRRITLIEHQIKQIQEEIRAVKNKQN